MNAPTIIPMQYCFIGLLVIIHRTWSDFLIRSWMHSFDRGWTLHSLIQWTYVQIGSLDDNPIKKNQFPSIVEQSLFIVCKISIRQKGTKRHQHVGWICTMFPISIHLLKISRITALLWSEILFQYRDSNNSNQRRIFLFTYRLEKCNWDLRWGGEC